MNAIRKFKLLILCGSVCFVLAMASQFTRQNDKLETLIAPRGLLSLQGECNVDEASQITSTWSVQQREIARDAIVWDNYLVFAYCIFLGLCVYYRSARPSVRKFSVAAFTIIAIAGIADLTENYFLQRFIRTRLADALQFVEIAGYIKWIGIGLTSLFLLWTFRRAPYLRWTFKGLTLYSAGLITLALLYFVLIKLVQGQDVVMQVAEYFWPAVFSALSVMLFSIFAWYSSRIVSEVKKQQPENVLPSSLLRHVPRLIAFNAAVCIQAAAWALPTIGNFTTFDVLIFVVVQNVMYVIISHYFSASPYKAICRAIIVIAVLSYGAFAAMMSLSDLAQHQRILPTLAFVLFVYSIVMVYLFMRRRVWLKTGTTIQGPLMTRMMPLISRIYPSEVPQEEMKSFVLFHYPVVIGMVLYISAFIFPVIPDYMGALAFTLLALGILVGLSNIISTVSIKRRVNFFLLIFLLAFAMGFLHDYYKVELVPKEHETKRQNLEAYFNAWVDDPRRSALLEDPNIEEFVVYLVIADGGASRSGYWVASVLSALEDSTLHDVNERTRFSDHLLCLAGASGGSVGNAAFYHLLRNRQDTDTLPYLHHSRAFLKQDFLTPVLTRWLGSDILQHIVPTGMDNRSEALESAMERFSKKTFSTGFENSFSDAINATPGRLPILFINSTHVQKGSPAVVSSVDLEGFSKRLDVIKLTDSLKHDLKFSTAVVLGARFPYVSPAGRIGSEYFVDGGYFDNTGAGVVHEMMQGLDDYISRCDGSRRCKLKKLRFQLLYLSNSSDQESASKSIHPLVNDFGAPLLTVLGTYSSQTKVNNQRLVNYLHTLDSTHLPIEYNLYRKSDTVDYPMNWVISDYNLERMDQSLDSIRRTAFPKLEFIKYTSTQ